MMLMIVFIKINLETQSSPFYLILFLSWIDWYTLSGSSVFPISLLIKFIHFCSMKKWRTKCPYWDNLKFCWKYHYFLSCILRSYIIPWTLFPSYFFTSPIFTRVVSLGKSHNADLCSRIWGMGRNSLTMNGLGSVFFIWQWK